MLISFLAIIVSVLCIVLWKKPKKVSNDRYPIAFHTVDVAIVMKTEKGKQFVLLAQKPNELYTNLWRFPGGFVDPTDDSAEAAAFREVAEETKMKTHNIQYICSKKIDDPRYRTSKNKIITSFFQVEHLEGKESSENLDDIAHTKWFPLKNETISIINPIHQELFWKLLLFNKL